MAAQAEANYYGELELTRSAGLREINDAYRRLALQFHPDKNSNEAAESRFNAVAEAYDILSNAERKAVFDQYGTTGLREGAPDANNGFTDGWQFHGDAKLVFRNFFGGDNPFADLFPPTDEFGVMPVTEPRTRKKQDPAREEPLYITMEEAYVGCLKKMKLTRRVMNEDGHTSSVRDKILTIKVAPGWKEGTKVTFPKEGDQEPNRIPADIVFVIKYKKHARFERVGNDLVHESPIHLSDALVGCVVEVKTLDGRFLAIPVNEVVCPGYTQLVPGEGMPCKAGKGNLVLKFNTVFPTSLTDQQKALVRSGLASN